MIGPHVGITLPSREAMHLGTPSLIGEVAVAAEAAGIGSLWAGDSLLARPIYDPIAVLSHVAAQTTTIGLGTGVLLAPMRAPVLTAQAIASLDQLSGGRLVLGVGRGFDLPEGRREFAAAGVDFDSRTARLEQTIALWRALWSDDGRGSIDQGYAHLDHEPVLPRVVRCGGPPLWLAGFGPTAFRLVGTHADGWLPYPPSADEYRIGWDAVRAEAERAGRDPASITPAVMLTVRTGSTADSAAELERYVTEFYGYPLDLVGLIQACWAGPADALVEHLRGYWDAGARVFVLRIAALDRTQPQLEALAEAVVPAIATWASDLGPRHPHADHPVDLVDDHRGARP